MEDCFRVQETLESEESDNELICSKTLEERNDDKKEGSLAKPGRKSRKVDI